MFSFLILKKNPKNTLSLDSAFPASYSFARLLKEWPKRIISNFTPHILSEAHPSQAFVLMPWTPLSR
jgi:hypothetical protein